MELKLNHKLILGGILSLSLFFSACSDDNDGPTDPGEPMEVEPANRTTGFVSIARTSTGSRVVRYFEELPTGTVDLSSDATDFPNFNIDAIFNGALFTIQGADGIHKTVVNADGEFIEEGNIALPGAVFAIAVRDSLTGVTQSVGNPNVISVFNPTTFELTGSIDMSAGFVPDGVPRRYTRLIIRGNDVFGYIQNATNGSFFTDFIVHQANLSTNTFVGDTRREGNGLGNIQAETTPSVQSLTDAAGNLYIPDVGNTEGTGLPARLNRVPAGSNEIDPTYVFEPAVTLNPRNVLLPSFESFTFLESGKAIAKVNRDIPQEVLAIIADAGGVLTNLTPPELLQLRLIVEQSETSQWCEIDVDAMTVTPIEGIPDVRPLSFPVDIVFEYDGDAYIPVLTEAENAYYRWNPTTGAVSKAFVTTGANRPQFFNIANND